MIIKSEEVTAKQYTIEKAKPNGSFAFRFFKRTFDIAASLVLGIVLFVPLLIIALLIRLDSPGRALYKQERLGKDGRPFMMMKFRTMNIDAEKDGPQWAETDDSRCTKLGAKLRKVRLDELPQLWNIFVGQMSFVGPRPERSVFYDEFENYIHGFSNRLAVTPGLTGLAQVSGGYDLAPEEKIIYDMEYIKTQTLALDIKLLFKTVAVIFNRKGAR